jgi:hypothetical protein
VHALLERGIGHAAIRRTIAALAEYGDWPLTVAPLATTSGNGGPQIVLAERGGVFALSGRGWQRLAVEPPLRRLSAAFPGLPARGAGAPDGD